MPLTILLVLVIGGIAAVAVALHMLGFSKTRKIDMAGVHADWLRHFPDDTFDHNDSFETLVTMAGDRAVLRTDQGYGLLWSMGADTSARRLDQSHWQETKKGVDFRFDDPGVPRIAVTLHNSERHLWLSYLRKIHGS